MNYQKYLREVKCPRCGEQNFRTVKIISLMVSHFDVIVAGEDRELCDPEKNMWEVCCACRTCHEKSPVTGMFFTAWITASEDIWFKGHVSCVPESSCHTPTLPEGQEMIMPRELVERLKSHNLWGPLEQPDETT